MDLFGLFKPNPQKLADKKDFEGLVKALQYKKNKFVRKHAAFYLGELGDTRAVDPLHETLKKDIKEVKEFAAHALGQIGNENAVDILIDLLQNDSDNHIQMTAALALGKTGNNRAVVPLIEALKNDEPYVRSKSAEALGDLGNRRAVEPLIKSLEDKEYFVKKAAVIALCKIGDKRALKPLIEIGGKQPIRLAAKIGDRESVIYLISILKKYMIEDYSIHRKDKIISINGLSKIGDIASLDQLIKSLKYDSDLFVRKKIPNVIVQFDDERIIPALINSLEEDEDAEVRMYSAISLENFRDDRIFKALIKSIRLDHDSEVRTASANLLLKIQDERTFQELMNIIANESPNNIAFQLLAKLDDNNNAIPVLIDYYFTYKPDISIPNFKEIFGDYYKIIIDSVDNGYDCTVWWDGYMNVKTDYKYDLAKSNKALETLVKLDTPISSNLLHKISQAKDKKVISSIDHLKNGKKTYIILDYSQQREIANQELKKRGNPPYDSSIYLIKENWILK